MIAKCIAIQVIRVKKKLPSINGKANKAEEVAFRNLEEGNMIMLLL